MHKNVILSIKIIHIFLLIIEPKCSIGLHVGTNDFSLLGFSINLGSWIIVIRNVIFIFEISIYKF